MYPVTSSQISTERSRTLVKKANDLVRTLLGHRASQSAHPGRGVSGLIAWVTHFSSPPLKASFNSSIQGAVIEILVKELFYCPIASQILVCGTHKSHAYPTSSLYEILSFQNQIHEFLNKYPNAWEHLLKLHSMVSSQLLFLLGQKKILCADSINKRINLIFFLEQKSRFQ